MKIRWHMIAFIGLTWFFILNGSCLMNATFPQKCNPRVLSTCEP